MTEPWYIDATDAGNDSGTCTVCEQEYADQLVGDKLYCRGCLTGKRLKLAVTEVQRLRADRDHARIVAEAVYEDYANADASVRTTWHSTAGSDGWGVGQTATTQEAT